MIEVNHLSVTYNKKKAVKDISFNVLENEIFGIIGENGAGKTTTTECIEGIRDFDTGTIRVNGLNPVHQSKEIQKIIGVQLQETHYPKRLKVKEVCELFSSFYQETRDFNDLLSEFDLIDHVNQYVEKLSGGQRQRLSIILALLHNPKVVFLDELTTGLDPRSRRKMWNYILHLKESGVTVIMTTHYMDEAEYLCDRVAVFNEGEIVALDTVPKLIAQLGYKEKVSVIVKGEFNIDLLDSPLISKIKQMDKELLIYGNTGIRDFVMNKLDEHGYDYLNFKSSFPNLEDVFFELTDGRED